MGSPRCESVMVRCPPSSSLQRALVVIGRSLCSVPGKILAVGCILAVHLAGFSIGHSPMVGKIVVNHCCVIFQACWGENSNIVSWVSTKLKVSEILGHAWVLQAGDSESDPGHGSPPCWGAGFVQVRVFSWVPPAQVTLQPPICQLLHWPWTECIEENI